MKKLLLFVLFKVLEIAGTVAIYLLISRGGYYISMLFSEAHIRMCLDFNWYSFYFFLWGLLIIVIGYLLYLLLPWWFKLNKEWVDNILD
jgi:hypothetical protein